MLHKMKIKNLTKMLSVSFVFIFVISAFQSVQADTFSKNLKLGDKSQDVQLLQQYLNSNGYPVANSGSGSAGHETTYFGKKTQLALMLFQQHFAQQILGPLKLTHATGNFFAATRDFLNKLLTGETQPAQSTQQTQNSTAQITTLPTHQSSSDSQKLYAIGGSIMGINGPITIKNNDDTLEIKPGDGGNFQFPVKLASGQSYAVVVDKAPTGETCYMPSDQTGAGVVGSADILDIKIGCTTTGQNPFKLLIPSGSATVTPPPIQTYTIGGVVSGLLDSVILQNNGADNLNISTNGLFTFLTHVVQGLSYNVTVLTQPSDQTCSVINGVGTNVSANVTNVNVSCATNAYTVGGTVSGLSGTVVLQNNGSDANTITTNGPFTFSTPVAEGSPYNVTVQTQPAGQTCNVTNGSGTMGGSNITNVNVSCAANATTLSVSVSNLALATSGTPRTITITNTGSDTAENISISYPTWPTGTTTNGSCGSSLNPLDSCVITVTPGANATSSCNNPYSAPTPGVVTVSADNVVSSVTTNVAILTYGCIYQGGYLFSIDDTTPSTGSIGGTVVAQTNQSSGVFWSSNGNNGSPDSSSDVIPGIDQTSTPSSGSPTYSDAELAFNSTYSNEIVYPFPSSGLFSACNGAIDGACNSSNILVLYNGNVTNYGAGYTLSPGPTSATSYAAGVCSVYEVDSSENSPCSTGVCYSHWYLPAICQLGAHGEGAGCSSGIDNMVTNLPNLFTGCTGASCLSGGVWSSTGYSGPATSYRAWYEYFSSGGTYQDRDDKGTNYAVRCTRALNP